MVNAFLVLAASAVASVAATSGGTPSDPLRREMDAWNAVKTGDTRAYGAMLATNYVGVYSDGVFDKAAEVGSIRNDHIKSVTLGNFSNRMLSRNDMLVTYSADVVGTSSGKDVSGRFWEASTWHRSGSRWLGTFHMETKAR
jgi:hypothetical protein